MEPVGPHRAVPWAPHPRHHAPCQEKAVHLWVSHHLGPRRLCRHTRPMTCRTHTTKPRPSPIDFKTPADSLAALACPLTLQEYIASCQGCFLNHQKVCSRRPTSSLSWLPASPIFSLSWISDRRKRTSSCFLSLKALRLLTWRPLSAFLP